MLVPYLEAQILISKVWFPKSKMYLTVECRFEEDNRDYQIGSFKIQERQHGWLNHVMTHKNVSVSKTKLWISVFKIIWSKFYWMITTRKIKQNLSLITRCIFAAQPFIDRLKSDTLSIYLLIIISRWQMVA